MNSNNASSLNHSDYLTPSPEVLAFIEQTCLTTDETDMIALMQQIRAHPLIGVHGIEHHSMMPAVILATYRNLGGDVSDDTIRLGIERGKMIVEKSCAYFGACGAALGVGIAFSLLLGASPYEGTGRQKVNIVTRTVLGAIGKYDAARCCQRDCWIALKESVKLSRQFLSIELRADMQIVCTQLKQNKYCYGKNCPLSPYQARKSRKLGDSG
ncbi:hypothetical protein K9N50_13305 [bacterium]|nr:hypothetical protein [bacterium]